MRAYRSMWVNNFLVACISLVSIGCNTDLADLKFKGIDELAQDKADRKQAKKDAANPSANYSMDGMDDMDDMDDMAEDYMLESELEGESTIDPLAPRRPAPSRPAVDSKAAAERAALERAAAEKARRAKRAALERAAVERAAVERAAVERAAAERAAAEKNAIKPEPREQLSPAPVPTFREFTDSTGQFKVSARFIEFRKGKAHLKKEDGTVLILSMEKLSDPDQQYIRAEIKNRIKNGQ